MITFAHVAGLPLEEMLPTLAGTGTVLLLVRGWLTVHMRRPQEPGK
jgi:hypothetical protein